jgi:hypothetical protein
MQEDWHWSDAWQRFKRSKGVKLNGILERNFLPKNEHRTYRTAGAVFSSIASTDRLIFMNE